MGSNGKSVKSLGVATVRTRKGEPEDLQFHVVDARVQPKLGYPGLKTLQMPVGCEEDCLASMGGKRLLCHSLRLKKEEEREAKQLYIKETQTKVVKGSRVKEKGGKLLIPAYTPVALGPRETRMMISAYMIEGTPIQGLFSVC